MGFVLKYHKNNLRQLKCSCSNTYTSQHLLSELLQDPTAAWAVTGPMGYSAAARHRRAGPDGRPRAARAVPVQIPLPLRRCHRPLCSGEGPSSLSPIFLCDFWHCWNADAGSWNLQPEPEFRPPMSEVVQSLVRLVQRANMTRMHESQSRRHGESGGDYEFWARQNCAFA